MIERLRYGVLALGEEKSAGKPGRQQPLLQLRRQPSSSCPRAPGREGWGGHRLRSLALRNLAACPSGSIPIAFQPLQIGAQLCRRLAAHLAIFFERLRENDFEFTGQIGIHARRRRRRTIQNRFRNHARGIAGERLAPGRHFVEHRAEAEKIRARVEFFAAHLLG